MNDEQILETQKTQNPELRNVESYLTPTASELAVLNITEKIGYKLTDRMNRGVWKQFWTFCQRHIGSLWIYLATYNLMNVYGLENVEQADVEKPLLLVANHRSFFDMYTVSSVLFRRTTRPMRLFFPVRAKFFYDSPAGWFVNFVMGWFSMFPPFFREDREEKNASSTDFRCVGWWIFARAARRMSSVFTRKASATCRMTRIIFCRRKPASEKLLWLRIRKSFRFLSPV